MDKILRENQPKSLLRILQEKMNISVLHATETEPVENAWCVFRAEQRNHRFVTERFFGETVGRGVPPCMSVLSDRSV